MPSADPEDFSAVPRSHAWHEVWDRRDPEKLKYDGYETGLNSDEDLVRLRTAQVAFISSTLNLGSADHLLDLGCGTGVLTRQLAPLVRRVTAVDYSLDAVALARDTMKSCSTVELHCSDLVTFDLGSVPVTKAVAVGSMHYLDSYAVLHTLLTSFTRRGVPVLVMDLPDQAYASGARREYDQSRWSHLAVDTERIRADFPSSRVHRGMFPWYANDAMRFSILISPSPSLTTNS
ncbi:MAG TPA: class I SAM-dependent methyltransferase [Acidimicrobiales bacterium]|nr:class I SAM-dependent methyltransferase [Acidimicrobiales bacterium]